jgi:alpha-L-fucosidase
LTTEENKAWWRESRFGMFIHWGLYSLLARGEWVQYTERIPVKEYEKLSKQFNPTKFDADEWVRLAKNAGMKYIVITAKHHDGFSMFKTDVSPFNIVDDTPYGKEILMDLASACQREGLKLCFYYSHVREWRHPHAQSLEIQGADWMGNFGNFWDYPDEKQKNLQTYIDDFDKPQLKELLTQYGPIGIIWFDTPSMIRPDQAQELVDLIRELQPNCLVNSRVSDDESVDYDYLSLGDCEIPGIPAGVDWETPMTICDAWGYNELPNNKYSSPDKLIHQLVDIVSLGGNLLLNVGPTADGVIPEEAQERLSEIGKWMDVNGDAIYGTKGSPFAKSPQWGRITRKGSKLYLHVYEWQASISLLGLNNKVKRCYLLSDSNCMVSYKQNQADLVNNRLSRLDFELPQITPDPYCTVVVLEIEGEPNVDQTIIQDDSGAIELTAIQATIHKEAEDSRIKLARTGALQDWFHPEDWLSWDYIATKPGEYEVQLLVNAGSSDEDWDYGHEVEIKINQQSLICQVDQDAIVNSLYLPITIKAGRITIDSSAQYHAELKALKINRRNLKGLPFASLQLIPVN